MTTDQDPVGGVTAQARARPAMDDEISLWEVLAVLLRRRGTIVLTTIAVAALAVAFTLLRADTFTTAASFLPQGSQASASELMALASQFGFNIGGGGEEASPAFYAELLGSREILSTIAERPYAVDGVGTTSLADLLEIENDTEELRIDDTIEWLQEQAVSVTTGRETGTVTVSVETEWPELSKAIVEALLDEIQSFNLDTRQSQAAAERRFIEGRVKEAQDSLLAAEEAQQAFLQANRQWENSPDLSFQHDRLLREVTLRQSVLTTLVQAYEQARISEVRDTPVITILQAPFLPPGPDDRSLLLAIALGIVLGGMMGVVLAFVVEAFSRPADGDRAREDFQQTWHGLVESLPFVGGRRT
jgi:uncharacterized protein involved in exopolysaccharide biosynthesis